MSAVAAMASEKLLLYTRVAPPKAPKKRSRAGCNFCKDKKKKCDEVRPTCSRCKEIGEDCQYDPVKPRQRRKVESTPSFNKASESRTHGEEASTPQPASQRHDSRGDASAADETTASLGWNTTDSLTDVITTSYSSPFDFDDISSVGQLESPVEAFFGSYVPTCRTSTDMSLAAISPIGTPSPSFEFFAPVFEEFSQNSHHRFLMDHFCNTLSHLIVLKEDEGNPFQQLVLPLAYSSSAVKSAIYALASAHLERNSAENTENDSKSVHFHNEAIRSLAKLIEMGDNANKNDLVATIMLLVYYEVLVQRRRSNLVEGHLKGAMAIMRNAQSRTDRTSLFLSRAFRFYDVIAALSCGTAPVSSESMMEDPALGSPIGSEGESATPGGADALLGLATSLWPVVHKLSGLLSLKSEAEKLSARGDFVEAAKLRSDLDTSCSEVEKALDEWQPTLPPEYELFESFPEPTKQMAQQAKQTQSILNTALAYRHSAMVHLYRTIYGCSKDHLVVQHHTHTSLLHCKATVNHGGPMGALLWPLFVASCEAVSSEDRDLADQAFRAVDRRQRMTNISRAWRVVQEVWKRSDEASTAETAWVYEALQGDMWRRVSQDLGLTIVFG